MNRATGYGGGICNFGNMSLSGNTMAGNVASISGNTIYNDGYSIGILNLTYLGNSTRYVDRNTTIRITATSTDDMGTNHRRRDVSFYINNDPIENASSIEGFISISYTTRTTATTGLSQTVNGTYNQCHQLKKILLKFLFNSKVDK